MKSLIVTLIISLTLVSCNSPEARQPVSVKTGSFIEKSVELNKELNSAQHVRIQQIIVNNPDIEYIASQNGFWYYYNVKVEGDSITPKFGDLVNFDYDVKNFDENIIYTQEEVKTQNYAMDQEELFSGLREGLKLIKEGESITFLFPSSKAFGYYGDNNKIGTNVPIKCRVTINSITKK